MLQFSDEPIEFPLCMEELSSSFLKSKVSCLILEPHLAIFFCLDFRVANPKDNIRNVFVMLFNLKLLDLKIFSFVK